MDRTEFLSDGWLDALQQVSQQLLDEGDTALAAPISYVEIFTKVPADKHTGAVTGYVLSFADGKASVRRAQSDNEAADCIVLIDYNAALATMRVRSGPDLAALGQKAFAAGTMTMKGSPQGLPISMNALHDALIDRTVPVGEATA